MEPPAKRRKVGPAGTTSACTQSSTSTKHTQAQPQSSSSKLFGTGVSNNNGNISVGRDLFMNAQIKEEEKDAVDRNRRAVLRSLEFDAIESRKMTIAGAHAYTCRWLLEDPTYLQWARRTKQQGRENLLWIKGKPGAGKSTLMKYLDEQLRKKFNKRENHGIFISFFLNARGSHLEKSLEGMYRSLLVQLLNARPKLQKALDRLKPVPKWDVQLLKNMFEKAVKKSTTICLIDALDECKEDDIREMVKSFEVIMGAGSQLHVCFASRHYPHISTSLGLGMILEDQSQHEVDIANYIQSTLRIKHSQMSMEIRRRIQEKASGVFMWVVLVVSMLNKENDEGGKHHLLRRLDEIPDDLHELLYSMLRRDEKHQAGLLLCIQWVLFAKEPLAPRQLYLAIVSGLEPQYLADCHGDDISEDDVRKYILNKSKGLTEATRSRDKSVIQFIHESVKDFLLKEEGLKKLFPSPTASIKGQSHEALKHCCLAYVYFNKLLDFKGNPRNATNQFPFLEYATSGVLFHAEQAAVDHISQHDFISNFPYNTWVHCHNIFQKIRSRRYTSDVSMLYILAEAGMVSLMHAIPNAESCFKAENERYGLPMLAAMAGRNYSSAKEMLKIRAEQHAGFSYSEFCAHLSLDIAEHTRQHDLDFSFKEEAPNLYEIIYYGGELITLFFLETETCSVGSLDEYGETVAIIATQRGYDQLLEELLRRGANTDAMDEEGRTALHWATQEGNLGLVQLLLRYNADASAVDNEGRTPLHYWSENEWNGTDQPIDTDSEDDECGDAAWESFGSSAATSPGPEGFFDIARLLLHHGADVNAIDIEGRTPLHYSSSATASKLFLNNGAYIHAVDFEGDTPLHLAVSEQKRSVSKLLLQRGADTSARNWAGLTPLETVKQRCQADWLSLEEYFDMVTIRWS